MKSILFYLILVFTSIIFAQRPKPSTCIYSEVNSILLPGFPDDLVHNGKLKSLRIVRFQLVEKFGELEKGDIANTHYYEFNELEALTKQISTFKIKADDVLNMKESESQSTIYYTFEDLNSATIVNVKYDNKFSEKFALYTNELCKIKYYDLYENEKFIEKVKYSYKKDTTDIYHYLSNGELSFHLSRVHNKNKKLLKAFSDNNDFKSTFSYDNKGNVIKVVSKNEIETYKYLKFDSYGNWLERQIFQNNKPLLYEIRDLVLY